MLTKNIVLPFEARKDKLFYYSPYCFLKNIPASHIQNTYINGLVEGIERNKIEVLDFDIYGEKFNFLLEYLDWDSSFFGIKTYRLKNVLFNSTKRENLSLAIQQFDKYIKENSIEYIFTEIPSEDIFLLQTLTTNGYSLIETRLTYFLQVLNYNNERYPVRSAQLNDIPFLRETAKKMRNPYDRFHADSIFTIQQADDFLATYVEESVKGYADVVFVPNQNEDPPEAFITAKYLKEEWNRLGFNISKVVLAAVSPKYKGWYKKLISEMAYHLKEIGAAYIFLHPASSNKAGIHVYESLGYKFGKATHILSK